MSESIGFRGALGSLGSGGVLGQVLVRVGLDTKQLDAGLAKAKGEAASAGTTYSRFGAFASAGLALAGVAAVKFAADAIKSADDHEQALLLLRQAIDGTTTAYESQANALQDLTGIQDEEILRADTTLARFKLNREEIEQTVPLLLDWARATGESATTAAAALGRALLGNTRGLKSIGIEFTSTGNRAKDLQTILKQLESRVGGTSEAFGQSFAGRIDILLAKFDDLKETVGTFLIAVIEQGITDLQGFGAEVERIINLIPGLKPSSDEAAEGLTGVQKASALAQFGLHAMTHPLDTLIHGFSVRFPDAAAKTEDAETSAAAAAFKLAEAHRKAADAALEQLRAEKLLAGGAVGLLASLDQLRAAQRDLTAARKDGKSTAADLRAAELNVLQAQLGVNDSFRDLVQKQKDAGASSQDILDKFDSLATKARLTKDEISSLTQFIQGYIDKLKQIPSSVNTDVTVNRNLVTTGGGSHPRPGPRPDPGDGRSGRGSGLTVNIINPTDPAQTIVNNLGAWQRQNRDWIG